MNQNFFRTYTFDRYTCFFVNSDWNETILGSKFENNGLVAMSKQKKPGGYPPGF